MPPKRGRSRLNKRKKNLDDESESYECSITAKRNLIPNSTAVFHPRRSLRSSTRLLEIGTTSLEHMGEIHVGNSTLCIPEKVGESDEDEMSLSTTSLEQMGEIDVGNSTLGIPEKVGASGEAEMSLSSGSNQMVGQQIFEAEAILFEQEPLVGEIEAETVPSTSLKLTEMVNMVRNEDDDEVDSTIQNLPEETVNGYTVDAEFIPTLSKIIDKYGDIAKNSKTRSVEYRSMLLEKICKIVSELDTKTIRNIKEKDLEKHIVFVQDMEIIELEVKWLHTRLIEILDAKRILPKFENMKNKLDSKKDCIKLAMSSLKIFEEQKKVASEKLKEASEKMELICQKEADWKDKLDKSRDDSTKLSQEINDAFSKVKRFLNCSLGDDLL